jgi:hypothetical protein
VFLVKASEWGGEMREGIIKFLAVSTVAIGCSIVIGLCVAATSPSISSSSTGEGSG